MPDDGALGIIDLLVCHICSEAKMPFVQLVKESLPE